MTTYSTTLPSASCSSLTPEGNVLVDGGDGGGCVDVLAEGAWWLLARPSGVLAYHRGLAADFANKVPIMRVGAG